MLNALWLDTFTTLCEIGHFTRTAERLHMTQSGVSQHVAKLEAQVGAPLLDRQGKSFTPTPAGDAVLALGRSRRTEERALRSAISHDDPNVGDLVVACAGSFAMLLYPQLLPLMIAAPRLTLRLEATPQETVAAGVIDGRFDLGITDHAPTHPRLAGERIGTEELCLVLPAAFPADAITFADLQERGLIAHPDGFAYAEELLGVNFPAEFTGSERLRIRSYVNQIGQIPLPVAEGLGYTVLPRSGIESFPGRDRLKVVSLSHPVVHDVWLITRRNRRLPARADRVGDMIRRTAADGS